MDLRPYQRASLDALYASWARQDGSGLIVLPTGAGKSLVIAALVREMLERDPHHRIVVVTHGSGLDQHQKAMTAASATAEA
jgi:DNA repair protein RadD